MEIVIAAVVVLLVVVARVRAVANAPVEADVVVAPSTTTVTAQDGATKQEYHIEITTAAARAAKKDADENFRKEAAYMAASFRNNMVPVSDRDYKAAKAAKESADAAAYAAADAAARAEGYF